MNGVRKKEIRGFFFDSMPSEKHEDHYAMYLEIIKLQKTDFKSMQDQQGRCKMCPNWWFSSSTEVKRHRRFLHPDPSVTQLVENMMEQQPADQSEKLQYYRFQWKVENGKFHNLSFPTYHKLLTHINKSGHERNKEMKEIDAAENVAERIVSREKETMRNFFSFKKKVSTADKMRKVNVQQKKIIVWRNQLMNSMIRFHVIVSKASVILAELTLVTFQNCFYFFLRREF